MCDLFLKGTVPSGTAEVKKKKFKLFPSEQFMIPATRHTVRWELGAPSRPVLGFQPLVAVSSLPFLARPEHKYVVI